MSSNPFVLDVTEYKRDINPLAHYVAQTAHYFSLRTGRPYEECVTYIRENLKPTGKFPFKDPKVTYNERMDNGDREQKEGTLSGYLFESIRNEELIVPTFTTYIPPHVQKSFLAEYIEQNVADRGRAKKAMLKAKKEGNTFMAAFKKGEQSGKKVNNNAISGAHVSSSTPLHNKSAHSTLTSNCRVTSGYGNANNEKFLLGNRHYFAPQIVRNNILSITTHCDFDEMARVMEKYGIVYPSVDDVMDVIRYSTELYWHTPAHLDELRRLVQRLTPIARAAFVYVGDLYHLRKYNDEFVRTLMSRLSAKATVVDPDPKATLRELPEVNRHLAAQICGEEMRGKKDEDLDGTELEGIYAATTRNITEVVDDYADLIRAFWVTDNVPASVAHFPDSIRRTALTSDTDSTIFTVQDWVLWHQKKISLSDEAQAVAASAVYLAAQTITHVLARMSKNFGIANDKLFVIAMKNEFFFPVFVPTNVAKHYYALISCQEGVLFKEFDKERKGVQLKNSNAPRFITEEGFKMMDHILYTTYDGNLISLNHLLKWVGDIERGVIKSISEGGYEFFRMGQIKPADAYKKEADKSNYAHYTFWQEVFADKYGDSEPPPFIFIKVSTDCDTPRKTREWLAQMKDRTIAAKIEAYMARTGKSYFSTFYLPERCVATNGMPEEIMEAINVRKVIKDTCKVFYMLLETVGWYTTNDDDKIRLLVSDLH